MTILIVSPSFFGTKEGRIKPGELPKENREDQSALFLRFPSSSSVTVTHAGVGGWVGGWWWSGVVFVFVVVDAGSVWCTS